MATLRDIRRRITGVKSTEKITNAMKMVAAAKLRRAQDAIIAARPYARTMKKLLTDLSAAVSDEQYPLLRQREIRRAGIVIVTADRGLCGAFNHNVIKAAGRHIRESYGDQLEQGDAVRLYLLGKKGSDAFSKQDIPIAAKHPGIFAELRFEDAQAIAQELTRAFIAEEIDRVDIVYNEFKSVAQQRVVVQQFLPIPQPEDGEEGRRGAPMEYLYEPSSAEILAELLPKHVNFQLWSILLESNAAEQGARMAAMSAATENAKDMIRLLTLSYNKARQAGITKELLEIVSGAEALKNAG